MRVEGVGEHGVREGGMGRGGSGLRGRSGETEKRECVRGYWECGVFLVRCWLLGFQCVRMYWVIRVWLVGFWVACGVGWGGDGVVGRIVSWVEESHTKR